MNEIIKERLVRNLASIAASYFYSSCNPRKLLKDMYLTDPNGCINEDYIGDDLMKNIVDKFYAVFDTIRDELDMALSNSTDDGFIEIYIDPSYEDSTVCLMLLGDRVLLKEDWKAWNFWWETEEALQEELYGMYLTVASKLEKTWPCWNLTENDITCIASEKGLSLEGKDIEEIARRTKKGIENALGEWPWDIIVEEAIRNTKAESLQQSPGCRFCNNDCPDCADIMEV